MKLYDYFRSSAAYRVRIALNLKGIAYEQKSVHLLRDGGEQTKAPYTTLNPQALVPALELDDGTILTQSLAIIEYLDQIQPIPRLLPDDPVPAARVRAVALAIACDTHPLNNLRVLNYLKGPLRHSQAEVDAWYQHWVLVGGLEPVEKMIEPSPFCFGDAPTLADICVVPQIFNARRFNVPLDHLPRIRAVEVACAPLAAFKQAAPENQPDTL